MNPDLPTLYILSDAPPDDPLDSVAAAMPLLAPHYTALHKVGPNHALSVRALRRTYELGVDRLLFDFTPPQDHRWAFDMLKQSPAAVLLGSYSPAAPVGPLANLQSSQRYAAQGHRYSPKDTVCILDATHNPAAVRSLPRPATPILPSDDTSDLILAVAPGAVETAYAALRGLRGGDAVVIVLTTSRRDANDLTDIIAAFGMPSAHVRYARTRAGIAAAMTRASGLIEIGDEGRPGLSDATFVAGCLGAPVLALTIPTGAGEAAAAFAASDPRPDPKVAKDFAAKRPMAGFANNLHALIEAGFARAKQSFAA